MKTELVFGGVFEGSDDRKWFTVSPLLVTTVEGAVAGAWLIVGWDQDTPWRPWPQLGVEARGPYTLAWVVVGGVALAVQTCRVENLHCTCPASP